MTYLSTKLIDSSLDLFISDEDLENKIDDSKTAELEALLPQLLTEPYTFGEFINKYIIDTILSEEEKKTVLTEDDYYKIIKDQFEKNGLKGKGTLDADGETRLNKMKVHLSNPATKVPRKVVYLFAFGLGMKEDDLAFIMKKGLQQPSCNLRDPDEAIWYYCLINDNIKNKPEKIHQLSALYKTLSETGSATPYRINQKYTYNLINDFKHKIQTEKDFINYLQELKQTVRKKNNLTIREEYQSNLSSLARKEYYDPDIAKIGFAVHEMDRIHSKALGPAQIERELLSQCKQAFDRYFNSRNLMDIDIILKLFHGITWQADTLSSRFNGTTTISRKDLILSYFLIQTPDMSDPNLKARSIEELRYLRYHNFRASMDQWLSDCNMWPLYVRDPFELFIMTCMFKEEPYEFFLAHLYVYICEEIKKIPYMIERYYDYDWLFEVYKSLISDK